MKTTQSTWLKTIVHENSRFRLRINANDLPTQRIAGDYAVITCMDPRVNLEGLGITQFTATGANESSVRVIRTIGAIAEDRCLIVGIYLAGIKEIAVVMHTDCGCCIAHSKIDLIVERMRASLGPAQLESFRMQIGEPYEDKLRKYLHTFQDPRAAVQEEVARIKALPFAPSQLVVHGLLYELETGTVEVVVNGYDSLASLTL